MNEFTTNFCVGFAVGALVMGMGFSGLMGMIAFARWDAAPLELIGWWTIRASVVAGLGMGLWFAIDEALK